MNIRINVTKKEIRKQMGHTSTYLWKSFSAGLMSSEGDFQWEINKCMNGFHASEKIVDAMRYEPMECLARVEVQGEHLEQPDIQCWEQMRVVKAWEWAKKDNVELNIYFIWPN